MSSNTLSSPLPPQGASQPATSRADRWFVDPGFETAFAPNPDPFGALWAEIFTELQRLVAATYVCSKAEPLASALPLRASLVAAVMECGTAVILARRQAPPMTLETPARALCALRSYFRVLFIARRGRCLTTEVHDALDAQAQRVERPLRLIQAEVILGAGGPMAPSCGAVGLGV